MQARLPIGVISIGSNDIHLLVATSDGIKTFDRRVNQSMLAELVGTVTGGVIPVPALNQAFTDLETLVKAALDYRWATFPPAPQLPLLVVDSGGGSKQILQGEAARSAVLMGGNADHLLSFAADPAQQTVTLDDLQRKYSSPALYIACEEGEGVWAVSNLGSR